MKRKFIIVMSAVLLVGGITGCGSKSKKTEDTNTKVVGEQTTENATENSTEKVETKATTDDDTKLEEMYTVEEVDGGVAITQYKATKENETIIIPKEINGKEVVSIGKNDEKCSGFVYDTVIKKVVIPDSVKLIGEETFRFCTNIETVEFGTGIEEIGAHAFNGCDSLKEVKLSEGLTKLGIASFSMCSKLSSVSLPKSLLEIGDGNFLGCADNMVIISESGSVAEEYTKVIAEQCNVTFQAQ